MKCECALADSSQREHQRLPSMREKWWWYIRPTSLIIVRAREQCRVAKSFEQNRRCSLGKNHPRLNPPEKPLFRIPRNRMHLNSKQMLKRGYDSSTRFFPDRRKRAVDNHIPNKGRKVFHDNFEGRKRSIDGCEDQWDFREDTNFGNWRSVFISRW